MSKPQRPNPEPGARLRAPVRLVLCVILAVAAVATSPDRARGVALFSFEDCCFGSGSTFCRLALKTSCLTSPKNPPVCEPRCPSGPAPIFNRWCQMGPRQCVSVASASAFDEELSLDESFAAVTASGPLGCELADEEAVVRVTITQDDSPVIAQGVWRGPCKLEDRWATEVRVGADPGESFGTSGGRQILPLLRDGDAEPLVPGAAHACALAEFRADGVARRAFQWCRDVKLVVK